MVQVPVQDARHLQLGQLSQFHAQGAAAEVEGAGVRSQLLKRGTLQGDRETTTQVGQVQLQAMRAGDHGERSQGAFAGFGLEDGGQSEELRRYGFKWRWFGCLGDGPRAAEEMAAVSAAYALEDALAVLDAKVGQRVLVFEQRVA